MKYSDFKYTAFISYRHLEPDATIAAAVQKMIETYVVPKDFRVDGKAPSFRVFRDREELSAGDLSDSIREALRQSYYLIVISSKSTPLSVWCTKEAELFRSLHGDQRILSILVEGEPHESFSQPLLELQRTIRNEAGETQVEKIELLAAELRPKEVRQTDFPGYRILEQENPRRLERLKKESLNLLKTEKYRIMAAILGCSYGDLRQRDKERRTRRLVRIGAFFSLLFLLFGLFMLRAYQKENQAKQDVLQINSSMLLKRARELLNEGDKVKALLIAREAMSTLDRSMSDYQALAYEHEALLNDALYPISSSLRTRISIDNNFSNVALHPRDNLVAVGYGNEGVGLFDAQNGALIKDLVGHKAQLKIINFSSDGSRLLTAGLDNQVILWDPESEQQLFSLKLPGVPQMARFSDDGQKILLAARESDHILLYRLDQDGNNQQTVQLDVRTTDVRFDTAAEKMLTLKSPGGKGDIKLYDFSRSEWIRTYDQFPSSDKPSEAITLLRLAADGKSFYAGSTAILFKIRLTDGEVLYRVNQRSTLNKPIFLERPDGTRFFLGDSSIIEEYDSNTAEKLTSNLLAEGSATNFQYHEKTNTLAISLDNGKVALWQNGVIIDSGVSLGGAQANHMIFNAAGNRLYLTSNNSKEALILDVESRAVDKAFDAQIVALSTSGKRTLFFDGKNFFIWNNQKQMLDRHLPEDVLSYSVSYFLDSLNYTLSDDGNWLAYYDYTIEDKKQQTFINIIDLRSGTERKILLENKDYHFIFSPDSRSIATVSYGGDLIVYDFQGKPVSSPIPSGGAVKSMVFGQDGNRLALNYMEGHAQIFDLTESRVLKDLPGDILWFNQTTIKGIYNRSTYVTSFDNDTLDYHLLDKEIEKTPYSDKDVLLYQDSSDRLLIIRNGQEKPVAYLLHFSQGRLLKSFFPSLTTYRARGFFDGQEGDLVLDQAFYSTVEVVDGQEFIHSHPKSFYYHAVDYETLLKESDAFLGTRQLSPDERRDLGLTD